MNPERLAALKDVFERRIVFNKMLGLEIVSAADGKASLRFDMKPELVGNFTMVILHGGVISSALDVVGAIAVVAGFPDDAPMYAMGTVDMRVDFLSPGKGKSFVATGTVMRHGRILSSTRMELVNDEGTLIATGTAVYRVTAKEEFKLVNL
ncbi:MAG TPA: thioesterase family protein [bacterium]